MGQDEVTTAKIEEYLMLREEMAVIKKDAEASLKELDEEIKTYMIQNNINSFVRPEDGMRLKVSTGTNTVIIKDWVIRELMKMGTAPDKIKAFLDEVTKKTAYDYIDMRKIKQEEGND